MGYKILTILKKLKNLLFYDIFTFFFPLLGFSLSIVKKNGSIFFLTNRELLVLVCIYIGIASRYIKNSYLFSGSIICLSLLTLVIYFINGRSDNLIVLIVSLFMVSISVIIWLIQRKSQ